MPGKTGKPVGSSRTALQILFIILALGVLAIPFAVVVASGTASLDATWTSLRIAAILAFSLIFLDITTGAFRPYFNRIYKARTVQRYHTAFALAGFALALAHGILATTFGLTGFKPIAVAVGPAALAVLTVIILTALIRRRFRHVWRWIHRLNYLVFAAILVHAFMLGYDVKNSLSLKVVISLYAALAAAGLAYRLTPLRPSADGGGTRR